MAHMSAADLAHGLKGTKFPAKKEELVKQARKNGASDDILDTIQEMPDGEFGSITDVEHAFSQSSGKSGSGGGEKKGKQAAQKDAPKGGHHSH